MKRQKISVALLALALACSCSQVSQSGQFHNERTPQMEISRHALDPLNEAEFERAISLLKAEGLLGNGWYLQVLNLAEPEKTKAGYYPAFNPEKRNAYAVIIHFQKNERYECVLNLRSGDLLSKKAIKGQPAILNIEYELVKKTIKSNPEWQKAMLKRGISNFESVFVDTWGPGDLTNVNVDHSHRILRASFYLVEDSTNPFARPIEGISAIWDATLGEIVQVTDLGVKPISPHKRDFSKAAQSESPASNSCDGKTYPWQISGTQVSWKNWRFRFQMHPREGLVLYDVGQVSSGVFRPILDRASLSEMIVPYSDPGENWYWRAAFDEGDYGIGNNANPLQRGVHFPVDGQAIDTLIADNYGNIIKQPSSVAIYERSAGVLWSHYNPDNNLMLARSAKELVITFIFTVGNYDYGISWVFKENGTIQMHAILTGMLLAKGYELNKCGRCSTLSRADQFGMLIDTNLIATAHQHFFNFRLDFAVDGPHNSIAEVKLEEAGDDIENPYGNVFLINEYLLQSESESMRNPDSSSATHWWVYNPNRKNHLGHFSGYVLEPGEGGAYKGKLNSMPFRAAPFLKNSLHVTQYHPEEMHAAGDFPNQNEGEGIPAWIATRDDSIVNKDLVVWYTLGVTHLPVVEDWPIMPIHKAQFTLKPMNFFEEAQGTTEL